MINPQTVKNANYDELSLHSHKTTNQSTERSKEIQVSCSFSRILDVPSTLWLGFVYDSTSLRRLRRLSTYAWEAGAETKLLRVHARSGEGCFRSCQNNSFANNDPNKLKPILVLLGRCQWQRLSPPACKCSSCPCTGINRNKPELVY